MNKLAAGLFLIIGMGVFILYFMSLGTIGTVNINNFDQLNIVGKAIFVWGYIGTFGIWIWMLVDFFKGHPTPYRVAWGFFLIVCSFVGATLYFFSVYVPRIRKESGT